MVYCCNDFIFVGVEVIGHYDNKGKFWSLNDISDIDDQAPYNFMWNIYLLRAVIDQYNNIEYLIVNNCPFCGKNL